MCGQNVQFGDIDSGCCGQLTFHYKVCKPAVLVTARLDCSELQFAKIHNLL